MRNCYSCKFFDDCGCGEHLKGLVDYLPSGICSQIKDIIIMQYDCEDYESAE